MTVLERQIDCAKDLLMIQRWDQAREQRYQTIRALRLLMEVHDRSNRLLSSLAMPSEHEGISLVVSRSGGHKSCDCVRYK